MSPASNTPGAAVVDASVFTSLCAKETTHATAAQALAGYAFKGWSFHTPNVVVAEVLFALCRKLNNGELTPLAYEEAVQNFQDQMVAVSTPPLGDAAFIKRAVDIQKGYGCSRSADSIYIALAEKLAQSVPVEIVTFDKDMVNQAAKNARAVTINLLPI